MKERKKTALEIKPRCAKGYSPRKLNGRWACVRDNSTDPILLGSNWFHADNVDNDGSSDGGNNSGGGGNSSGGGGGGWNTNTAGGSNTSNNINQGPKMTSEGP